MSDRIDILLDLTHRLSALVEREMELIRGRQPERLAEHEDERTRLSLLYTREMQGLRNDDAARQADRSRVERLKAETAAFNETLARHQKLIARMRRVTEGIVKAIGDEAARQRSPRTVYAPTGRAGSSSAAAIAFDRKI